MVEREPALLPARPDQRRRMLAKLPAFPPVVQKLLELVSQPECPVLAVSRLIQSDATFSAEVLRLANSAIFAMRFEVVSILHAIAVLGLDRLKALVITVGMRDLLAGLSKEEVLTECWRHNLACAFSCERLAPVWGMDPSVTYTAGLLHEVGRMVLLLLDQDGYRRILQESRERGTDLQALENRQFGLDHIQAGKWVAEDWGLPAALREGEGPAGLRELVLLGCEVADRVGFAFAGPPRSWDEDWLRQRLGGEVPPHLAAAVAWAREAIPYKINLFEQEFLNG